MKKKIKTAVNNVLWATDFSKESKTCLPYLQFFSKILKTKNHAVHVLPKFSDWVYEAAFFSTEDLYTEVERSKQKAQKKLTDYSARLDLDFKNTILEGIASEEIRKYAEENQIDVIFTGRRGVSEIEQFLIGSTTSRLIRNSNVPVFVTSKQKKNVKIEKIICPIDLEKMTMPELKYSIALAKQFNAKLIVVHISEFFNYRVPILKMDKLIKKINDRILNFAHDQNYEIHDIIYDIGEPAHKIIEISHRIKGDLIIMATSQKSGVEKFFLGSITEKVLMHAKIPLLILPLTHNVLD